LRAAVEVAGRVCQFVRDVGPAALRRHGYIPYGRVAEVAMADMSILYCHAEAICAVVYRTGRLRREVRAATGERRLLARLRRGVLPGRWASLVAQRRRRYAESAAVAGEYVPRAQRRHMSAAR